MRPDHRRLRLLGLAVAAAVLAADQLSKLWLIAFMAAEGGHLQLTGFFNLVMVWNRGISFGLFQSDETGRWILTLLALAISVVLAVWLWRSDRQMAVLGIGAVIGGALGNIGDRVFHGAVADFFDFHLLGYHWPAFNVADAAITVGVGLLLIDGFRGDARAAREAGPIRREHD